MLDCGEGSTTAVPVYEGFAVTSAITRSDIGGCDVTDQLQLLLRRNGVALTTSAEREVVREMKEKVCEVDQRSRLDAGYMATSPNVTYRLPDGNVLTLGPERSRAAEVLFCPSIIGSEDSGAAAARAPLLRASVPRRPQVCPRWSCAPFRSAIWRCNALRITAACSNMRFFIFLCSRATLLQSVVLSGGSTLLRGFGDRLLSELKRVRENVESGMRAYTS